MNNNMMPIIKISGDHATGKTLLFNKLAEHMREAGVSYAVCNTFGGEPDGICDRLRAEDVDIGFVIYNSEGPLRVEFDSLHILATTSLFSGDASHLPR